MPEKTVLFKIKRQDNPESTSRWEEFELSRHSGMNVISSLMDKLEQPIRLEPFSKFPVIRDLAVDRSVLFENLKAVKAWVPIDGSYDLGAGPRMTMEDQEEAYPLSRCISCCCCMEACPQFNESTGFVGAATISQVRLFNTHP